MHIRVTVTKKCQESRIGIKLTKDSVVAGTDRDIGLHLGDKLCFVNNHDVTGAHHCESTKILKSMNGSFDVVAWRDHFLSEDDIVVGSQLLYNNILHEVMFFTETAVMCSTTNGTVKIRTNKLLSGCEMYCPPRIET